ncbi:M50 family metallopeptidase [Candidatus Woesearchaeota archaeon]|nr:M50 family metallopeptidase [Candidatus Woesearchaeota archaeon]
MLFSIQELIDIVLMTVIVGYIFKDAFPQEQPDVFTIESMQRRDYKRFMFAILAVAPAIILHEVGHKFAALAFGIPATFHAAYTFLLLGLLLKLLQFPFIFFVPAYVSHAPTTVGASIVIALAGPLVHGVLWLGSRTALQRKWLPRKYRMLAAFTQYINGFLFVFNMLPIPGFDGYHVLSGLLSFL